MAKHVRFNRDYDLRTAPRVVKAFKAGTEDTLTDAQADEVVAKGAGEVIADKTPSKRKGAGAEGDA